MCMKINMHINLHINLHISICMCIRHVQHVALQIHYDNPQVPASFQYWAFIFAVFATIQCVPIPCEREFCVYAV